jgi:hypothetical protein
MAVGGYNGKILRVNLSGNRARPEIIEDQFYGKSFNRGSTL